MCGRGNRTNRNKCASKQTEDEEQLLYLCAKGQIQVMNTEKRSKGRKKKEMILFFSTVASVLSSHLKRRPSYARPQR